MLTLSQLRKLCWPVFVAAFLSVILNSVSGCSKTGPGAVSGKVTYNGSPVPNARLTFYPAAGDGAPYPVGVKDDGTFSVGGIPPGEYKVTVETSAGRNDPMAAALETKEGGLSQAELKEMKERSSEAPQVGSGATKAIPIPPKYSNPQSTPLTWEFKPGSNASQDFVLTD